MWLRILARLRARAPATPVRNHDPMQGIPPADLGRIVVIIAAGMVASLLFTAQAAVVIRSAVKTELQPPKPAKAPTPFTRAHVLAWGAAAAASFLALLAAPSMAAQLSVPFLLASTVLGLLAGSALPTGVKVVLHPVITCAAVAQGAAALTSAVTGSSFSSVLKAYLTKGAGPMGGGDILMSFLGTFVSGGGGGGAGGVWQAAGTLVACVGWGSGRSLGPWCEHCVGRRRACT